MPEAEAQIYRLALQGSKSTLGDEVDLRELIPGAESVRNPIRYSDDIWEMNGYPLVNRKAHFFDFRGLPRRWVSCVKDWTLLRLNPHLAVNGISGLCTQDVMASTVAAERAIKVPTAISYVNAATISLRIIDRNGWEQMSVIHWESFVAQLTEENATVHPLTLVAYSRPLLSLWSCRGLLGIPTMFGGRPFGGRTLDSVFKVVGRDQNVERPSPETCGPLLGLSLWVIENCAEDILSRLEMMAAVPDMSNLPIGEQNALVNDLLLSWERTERPLPAIVSRRWGTATAAWSVWIKFAGCSIETPRLPTGATKTTFEKIQKLRGISIEEDGFDLPIAQIRDSQGVLRRWTEALVPTPLSGGLDYWSTILAYCCAFVIALLTTVRDRELAAIPNNCLVEGTFDRGDIDVPVTRMRGYLVKNRTKPMPATWVVGGDVTMAVDTIHRLKRALRLEPTFHPQTGDEVLLHPGLGGKWGPDKTASSLSLSGGYLKWLQKAGSHLSERGMVPPLPEMPEGLSHRAIRMTGIDAYASQAWGDALAAAQGHWSRRTVAEGYLGHLPRSVFVADPDAVEEARQFATAQALLDVADDSAKGSGAIAGNGTARLSDVLENANAYELVTGPVTRRQLLIVAKHNPNVFVGEFTVCVHGAGGLCGDPVAADFKLCRPFICKNSAVTEAQRARLELRRRGLENRGGVFERAHNKIIADDPELAETFRGVSDASLRILILSDLPGRFVRAAEEGGSE